MKILVLDGNENQSVAAVRGLAAGGHTVVVGADSSWSKAGWSRAASGSFMYPAPQHAVQDFVARIVKEVQKASDTLVLPMTERTTIPLSTCREEIFAAGGRLVLPAHETVLRAFDKQQTTDLARSLGIAVPRTTLISNRSEAQQFAAAGYYPVVLKARSSEELSVDGRVLSTGAPTYARNAEEFLTCCEEMNRRCSAILAQEFVAGTGAGYFALMHQGELRAEFAHRRIRDVRPTGSGSAYRESVLPDARIRESSLKILHALKWHGVAMVEFRQRPDGTPVFLEVNGRFWNSLPLAIYAGVNFPGLLAEMAARGDIQQQSGYRVGVRCRWLLGDLRHVLEVWRGAPKGYPVEFPSRLRALMDFLTPVAGTYHDNFNLNDPLPGLGDWLDFFTRKVPAGIRKKSTGSQSLNVQSGYSLP